MHETTLESTRQEHASTGRQLLSYLQFTSVEAFQINSFYKRLCTEMEIKISKAISPHIEEWYKETN